MRDDLKSRPKWQFTPSPPPHNATTQCRSFRFVEKYGKMSGFGEHCSLNITPMQTRFYRHLYTIPYPLGDFYVIGDRIGHRRPILLLITLWVWPINWVLAHGRLIAGRPESPGDWMTADLYEACLIFHH